MILAGDVGGTKTALALFERRPDGLGLVRHEVLPSREFPSVEAIVARFVAVGDRIDAASFGVAGPVIDGRVTVTNLPWHLEEGALVRALGTPRVKLINDLEAAGYGVLSLPSSELATLQAGNPRPGNRVLIAAGTGLGEAILAWDGRRHRVIASEGGHTDFAPRTEQEIALLRFLSAEVEHVSYERILSGPGLHSVYRFVRQSSGTSAPAWLEQELAAGDPAAVVSQAALRGADPVCVEALDLFVSIYGAEAGNLTLKALAVGGAYIGGGIAPKIRTKLADGPFLAGFRNKGRLAPLMESVPIAIVLDPRAPLYGAAHVAESLVA